MMQQQTTTTTQRPQSRASSLAGSAAGGVTQVMSRRPVTCCQRMAAALQLPCRALGISTAVVLLGVGVDLTYHGQHTWGTAALCSSILLFFLETAWVVTLFLQLRRKASGRRLSLLLPPDLIDHHRSNDLMATGSSTPSPSSLPSPTLLSYNCSHQHHGVQQQQRRMSRRQSHHQQPHYMSHQSIPSCWAAILRFSGWKKSVLYGALGCFFLARPHRLWLCSGAGAMLVLLAIVHMHLGFCLQPQRPLLTRLPSHRGSLAAVRGYHTHHEHPDDNNDEDDEDGEEEDDDSPDDGIGASNAASATDVMAAGEAIVVASVASSEGFLDDTLPEPIVAAPSGSSNGRHDDDVRLVVVATAPLPAYESLFAQDSILQV